jgi:tetratricopeptide (TPR) repeat protein
MGKVNRKVSPNPVMWYNQNRQWVTQNGIRTGMVGTACDLLLVGLGATYRALGDYEKAMSYLQELLKKLPGSVWGRVELGLTQVSLGETEAALQTFREAIQTAPQMWQPRYYLAEACFQKGDLEACQQVLREALELPLDKEAVNRILTLLDRAKGP